MAGRAITKKTQRLRTRLECKVIGVRTKFRTRAADFDFGSSPIWAVEGSLGPHRLTPRVLDLLDLVGGIYRVESQIATRPTNPAKEWKITAPVRDVAFWSSEGGARLASVLGFLNRALWTFTFEARGETSELLASLDKARKVREVILFSGGMDSACGAGVHSLPKEQVLLVSFYTNQRALQQKLARELGYAPPTQWRLQGRRGKEGMDLIRALMFLTLGAVTADTFGASTIVQYENAVLAMAIPPSGSFVPTRHAHPEFHLRLERLFGAVFEQEKEIVNPFGLLTKREEAQWFAKAAGIELSETILRQTQSCWRLSQAHVGGKGKSPWVPCGVCTPCIVRRTARPQEAAKGAWKGWPGYAFDLKKRGVRNQEKLGLTFRAYLELIGIALNAANDRDLIEELAPEARALIGGPAGPSQQEAAAVLRKFANEFCETFDIAVPAGRP
jgi:7-cyano-7-deazaguanine synthase in queuosine biosynthesis